MDHPRPDNRSSNDGPRTGAAVTGRSYLPRQRGTPISTKDTDIKLRIFNLCSWGGIVALALTALGWLIAGLLPLPLGPSNSMHSVVDFYTSHSTRRMIGFVLSTLGVCFLMPLVGVITIHMLRMERRLPLMAFIQLGAGSVTMFINLGSGTPTTATSATPSTAASAFSTSDE